MTLSLTRCKHTGCRKSARAGGAEYCAAHGGGRRCAIKGCRKSAASGGQPFCIAHGGGKRCDSALCEKSAVRGGGLFCALAPTHHHLPSTLVVVLTLPSTLVVVLTLPSTLVVAQVPGGLFCILHGGQRYKLFPGAWWEHCGTARRLRH